MNENPYDEMIAELNRRYHTLQRRTILYGLLAVSVAMLFSLWLVSYFSLSGWTTFAIGLLNGTVFTQAAVAIVRWLNPLSVGR